jgi:hypothetical protein
MIGSRNLAPDRGPSVWNREDWPEPGREAASRRWLTGLGGATMALAGVALAAYGGKLVFRAAAHCDQDAGLAARASTSAAELQAPGVFGLEAEHPLGTRTRDAVGEESAESFPASDAPSWTPTMGPRGDEAHGE